MTLTSAELEMIERLDDFSHFHPERIRLLLKLAASHIRALTPPAKWAVYCEGPKYKNAPLSSASYSKEEHDKAIIALKGLP